MKLEPMTTLCPMNSLNYLFKGIIIRRTTWYLVEGMLLNMLPHALCSVTVGVDVAFSMT